MDLKEIMNYKTYVVLGSTDNEEKYAYKIKKTLLENDCLAVGVPKIINLLMKFPLKLMF